ncbi:MAG: Plug domain-containing protein [Saprospiraceae bacterium]|nr:Plug domain-containing protein [Saprospiraceae bacterium]
MRSDCTSSGTITADKIRKLPTKSISDIAASSTGVFSSDGSEISVRGSRSDETVYFLDGVRVTSSSNLHSEKSMESDRVGKITAGEWNDLNNWEKWSDLLVKDEFKNMNNYWTIHTSHRYPVFITNTSHYPISGVSVFLKMTMAILFGQLLLTSKDMLNCLIHLFKSHKKSIFGI